MNEQKPQLNLSHDLTVHLAKVAHAGRDVPAVAVDLATVAVDVATVVVVVVDVAVDVAVVEASNEF